MSLSAGKFAEILGKRTLITTNRISNFSFKSKQKYDIVVVGGGAGGASISNALGRKIGAGNVAVIEPQDVHFYQPMWTLIGAGLKRFSQCHKPMKDVLVDSTWIKDKVTQFEPTTNSVRLENGEQIRYDVLVIAIGLKLCYEKIKGLPEAFETNGVCSNYHRDFVHKTLPAIQSFQSGNAIFTYPDTVIKCPGAPQKIMYLAEEYFRKAGKRDQAKIFYCSASEFMFGVKHYNPALEKICDDRGITRLYRHTLTEVDAENREAHFDLRNDQGESVRKVALKYSMLHISPPCAAPSVLARNGKLADGNGFLDLDKNNLQHKSFKNVFGLGDCANLPTSRTAAAAAVESGVLQRNIIDFLENRDFSASFNGYASCPLITGSKRAIMPEFDYSMTPLETFPFDQSKESRLLFHMKADLMPAMYWHGLVRGIWKGPALFRKIFHPLDRH